MRRTIRTMAVVLLLATAAPASAQSPDPAGDRLTGTIKPSLVAISVADADETARWYRDNLGFVLREKMDFPQYSLRLAFLELNGFEIELVEDKKSVPRAAIRKYLPEADDGTRIQGFVKLAFTVADVEALATSLRSKGVRFQMGLTESNRRGGVKFFIVRDNNGNWIQFLGSSNRTR